MVIGLHSRHAGIAPPARPTEEPVFAPAQGGSRLRQFTDPVTTELIARPGAQLRQLGRDDLTFLAERPGPDWDVRSFPRVASGGPAGGDALVVGVRMYEQHPTALYRGHSLRLVRSYRPHIGASALSSRRVT